MKNLIKNAIGENKSIYWNAYKPAPIGKQLTYISSTRGGGERITTDFKPCDSKYCKVQFSMEVLNDPGKISEYYYFAGNGGGSNWFSFENNTGQGCAYWNIGSSTLKGKATLSVGTKYDCDIIYNNGALSATVGSYKFSTTYSGTLGSSEFMFFGSDTSSSYVKLYYLKLYSSNTSKPTCDFIPAIRNSDNAICLYDRISRKFYTNTGSGTFIGGTETGGIIY